MESTYLRTLLEVLETGSFSRAAARLGISQSAVSRRLKCLEDHYGLPLLDRSGPSPVPTPAGRLVSEKARLLLELEQGLRGEIREAECTRPLAFCCTPAFGAAYLPEIMRRFLRQQPRDRGLAIHFAVPERILSGLRAGRFDVVVLDGSDGSGLEDLPGEQLPDDQLVFLSHPDLAIPSPEASLDRLLAEVLLTRREGCCSRECLAANLAHQGRRVEDFRSVVVIDDLDLLAQALLDRRGVSYVPRRVFAAHLNAGRLVEHRVPGFVHQRPRRLLVSPESGESPALGVFQTVLQEVVTEAEA